MMKYVIILATVILWSCKTTSMIEGVYRCDNTGKRMSLVLASDGDGYLYTQIGMNRFIDTINWSLQKGIINIDNIDSVYLDIDDSQIIITIPSLGLYSSGHILFLMNNSFFVFYKTEKDKKNKDDFYYTLKQTSGEEEQTIKKYFGDTVQIINLLNHDSPPIPKP